MATMYQGCSYMYKDVNARNKSCGPGPYNHPQHGKDHAYEYVGTSIPNTYDLAFPCPDNHKVYQTKAMAEQDCPGPIKMYKCWDFACKRYLTKEEVEKTCHGQEKNVIFL